MLLAVYTLLTAANSLLYRGMKGIHWFSLYNVFALMGAIAVAMRGQIPDFASIVLGNLFVVVGYALLFMSLAVLFGFKRSHVYFQLGLIAVAVVTMIEFGWIHPDTKLRLMAYSVVLGLQQAQIAWFVFREKRRWLSRCGWAYRSHPGCAGCGQCGSNAGSFLAWGTGKLLECGIVSELDRDRQHRAAVWGYGCLCLVDGGTATDGP